MSLVSTTNRAGGIDILFVILDVGLLVENSAVFQSQVVDQLVALKRLGYAVGLVCAIRDVDRFLAVSGHLLSSHQIPCVAIKDRFLVINLFTFAGTILRHKSVRNSRWVYVRGVWAAVAVMMSRCFREARYHYDVRGDLGDEALARGRSMFRVKMIRAIERLAIRHANRVTCVTTDLAESVKLRAKLRFSPMVIPSCIDVTGANYDVTARGLRRTQLGYDDNDIVLVYSGGLARYQMVPEMLALWLEVMRQEPRARFLLMVNTDPASLGVQMENIDRFSGRLSVLKLPRSQVFETLCACDVGFLLRENRALNAAASPVKFPEYLAAGLAVATTVGLGDISGLVQSWRVGIVLDTTCSSNAGVELGNFIRDVHRDRAAFRSRAIALVRERYDWCSYRSEYQELYM